MKHVSESKTAKVFTNTGMKPAVTQDSKEIQRSDDNKKFQECKKDDKKIISRHNIWYAPIRQTTLTCIIDKLPQVCAFCVSSKNTQNLKSFLNAPSVFADFINSWHLSISLLWKGMTSFWDALKSQ